MVLEKTLEGIMRKSQTIQFIQKQSKTAADLSKTLTALPLKWLTEKPNMGSLMASNKREITGLRAACTGAVKCSAYIIIN